MAHHLPKDRRHRQKATNPWDYHLQPKSFLRTAALEVTNPKTGKSVQARAVDWGPNENTGRIADLSPGLAKELGLETDDVVRVRIYE